MTRPTSRPAIRVLVLLVIVLAALVAGCGSASPSTSGSAIRNVAPTEAVAILGSHVVIDVRTPAEYSAGHIKGAQNIDVEASDFAARIAPLDHKAAYLVYCRSGRRSAIAASQMAAAGFSDIVDGGAMDALVAAGAPTQ
jgi:phage shock protein E